MHKLIFGQCNHSVSSMKEGHSEHGYLLSVSKTPIHVKNPMEIFLYKYLKGFAGNKRRKSSGIRYRHFGIHGRVRIPGNGEELIRSSKLLKIEQKQAAMPRTTFSAARSYENSKTAKTEITFTRKEPTMLEINKGKSSRAYENEFFRQFSKTLSLFLENQWDGLLLGMPECRQGKICKWTRCL